MSDHLEIFNFNPDVHSKNLQEFGYVHINNAIAEPFLSYINNFLQKRQVEALSEWNIKNKKEQILFEFSDDEMYKVILKMFAALIGSSVDDITIAERHIKIYDENAEAYPIPHKDRLASQYAIGIPISNSDEARIVLFPEHSRTVNPLAISVTAINRLDLNNVPDELSLNLPNVSFNAKPGDMVIFKGSSIYHERLKGAKSIVLYLKINTMGLDPLCEDPKTPINRARSIEVIDKSGKEELLNAMVIVAPKVYKVSSTRSRLNWMPVFELFIGGEKEVLLSEEEYNLLLSINGSIIVKDLAKKLLITNSKIDELIFLVTELVRIGALDIRHQD